MPQSAGEFLARMNAAQHQSMLLGMGSMGADASAEMLAGGMMSRGMAIGRPMVSGAMGLMGLDPFSLGMRAGMGAWAGGGGVLGAGLVGMGTMAGVGMLGVGAGFAANQIGAGAHQQYALNQSLRGMNFMNAQGGMGFTSGQSFDIGSAIRNMSHQVGPSGEVTTFNELSSLAANMGRMGMADGARSAREFKEKFKQLLDTVKVVAHEFGTSLEEAQRVMTSMRGSGIFGRLDQIRMATGARSAALSGGLALSEVTGAANIGSQISRAVGGLGRQGAFGGMRTIEQIGVAQQVGAISEEDIYNATGLTGAEGRQALASAQMQQSARFLSGGRGRRFLASIAGRDGTLNEDAAMEYLLGGGVETDRTMELARGNLRGIGRANFIRNEGRLRGAALEKFGGLAQSMVYQQWLGSRGYDPNNMDDRSMLAFQRFSGMGRDEADLAIKQLQAMPEMVRSMGESQRNMAYSDQLQQYRNSTGIQGLKRKFDQARETVQSKLQGVGARILQSGQEQVESWFNQMMGIYVDTATDGLEQIAGGVRLGGAGSMRQFDRFFGGAGKALATGGGRLGTGDIDGMLRNQGNRLAASLGSSDPSVLAFGEGNAEFIKTASLAATGGTSAHDSLRTFRYQIAQRARNDPAAKALLEKFDKAGAQGQYAIMQTLQERAGVDQGGQILSSLRNDTLQFSGNGRFHSEAEQYQALGRRLAGQMDTEEARYAKAGWFSKAVGSVFGAEEGAMTADGSRRAASGRDVTNWIDRKIGSFMGEEDRFRGIGKAFADKDFLPLLSDLNSDNGDVAAGARGNVLNRLQKIRGGYKPGSHYSESDLGTIQALGGSLVASKYGSLLDRAARGEKVDLSGALREYRDITGDESDATSLLQSMRREGAGAVAEQQLSNAGRLLKQQASGMAADRESLARMGIARFGEGGKVELLARGQANRSQMTDGQRFADDLGLKLAGFDLAKPSEASLKEYLRKAGVSGEQFAAMDPERQNTFRMLAGSREYEEMTGELYQTVGALSIEEKRKLARMGGASSKAAAYEAQVEQRFASLSKKPGGELGAVARLMGVNVDDETLRGLASGDRRQGVEAVLRAGGITNKELGDELAGALGKDTRGGRAAAIDAALARLSPDDKAKLQEGQARQNDPNFRALDEMRRNSGRQIQLLEALVRSNDRAAEELGKLSKNDPEGKGQPPAGPGKG